MAEQWLKYFREELPAVAFKSSTQKQVGGVVWIVGGVAGRCFRRPTVLERPACCSLGQ